MNIFNFTTAEALALVVSLVIPGLSALLARGKVPQNVAGFITLVLAAANGFFTGWADSSSISHYDWKNALGVGIYSLIVAIASHYGFWKSTETEAHLLAVGNGPKPAVAA